MQLLSTSGDLTRRLRHALQGGEVRDARHERDEAEEDRCDEPSNAHFSPSQAKMILSTFYNIYIYIYDYI